MIAQVADLDTDFAEIVAIEQVTGEFAAGAGEIGLGLPVIPVQHPLHPQLGTVNKGQHGDDDDDVDHDRLD